MTDGRKFGRIDRLFPDKGFGFIVCPSDGSRIFFHARHVTNRPFEDLVLGEFVEFEVGTDRSGRLAAENVVVQ